MRIEVNNKKEFAKALQTGGMLAGTSRLMPILDCVKIKSDGEKMTFVSTDTENAISKVLTSGVNSDEECTLCVSMKDLTSYIKLISDDTFEMVQEDSRILSIRHSKGNFDLPLYDAAQFPSISHDDEYKEYYYESDTIRDWFSTGIKFIPNDEFRPQMNGLYMYSQGKGKGCCATNGHSLFTDSINEDVDLPDTTFILNKNAVKIINSALNDSPTVKVKIGVKNVLFHWDSCSVIARIPEGRYPNFKSVIPSNNDIEVKANKNELINAITRCAVGANVSAALAKISVEGFNMDIYCEDVDFNKKAVEHVMVESTGVITIGLKYTLLIDVLNSISTDNVIIQMKDPSRAVIFKEDNGNPDKLLLLMPMLLTE